MATSKVSSFHLETVVVELAALEDIAQELVEHICTNLDANSGTAFRTQCDGYIKEGKLRLLVEAFVDGLQAVGGGSTVSDMECRFGILFSLARHLPGDVLTEVVPRIVQVVLSLPKKEGNVAQDQAMRMEVLRNLYTIIDSKSPARFTTLSSILSYSLENGLYDILDSTTAADVEELSKLWSSGGEVDLSKKQSLFVQFCDLAEKKRLAGVVVEPEDIKRGELKEHRFLMKLLETYENPTTTEEELTKVSKYAARAAVIAINYPLPGDMTISTSMDEQSFEGLNKAAAAVLAVEQQNQKGMDPSSLTAAPSSIAKYVAIQHLAKVPEYRLLSEFLHIFAAQGLNEYLQFEQGNGSFLNEWKFDSKICLRNIRLLTLATVASEQESVSYQTLAEKLQIEQSKVEEWIIDAIVAKLIDAKMDQLNQTIVMNRGSQRLLSDNDWVQVQAKLQNWKSNVRSLLQVVQSARQDQQIIAQKRS